MEELTVSLPTARRLKEANFPQGQPRDIYADDGSRLGSYFIWTESGSYREGGESRWFVYEREEGWQHHKGKYEWFAAPTIQEILDQLPTDVETKQIWVKQGWIVRLGPNVVGESGTLSDALALTWLKMTGNE